MLSLQPEAVNVSELGRHGLTIFLRGFEARQLDRLQRFLIESHAATLDNLGLRDLAFGIDLDL